MTELFMANVGHGLCMAIRAEEDVCQIDCGDNYNCSGKHAAKGLERIFSYFSKPNIFVLSHFHLDHYNGLLYHYKQNHKDIFEQKIEKVYFLGIPKMENGYDKKLFLALLSMNIRLITAKTIGDFSGSMELDFLDIIFKLNGKNFTYKPLYEGDKINIGNESYKIIWPPKTLDSKEVLKKISDAIDSLEKAKKEDKVLERIYTLLRKRGIFERYFERKDGEIIKNNDIEEDKFEYREIPKITREANKKLRKIANYFSLGFFNEDKLLFMGDAEEYNINKMIDYLNRLNKRDFKYFIAPHHGTHWGNSLWSISWDSLLVSKGENFSVKREFYTILKKFLLHTIVTKIFYYHIVYFV